MRILITLLWALDSFKNLNVDRNPIPEFFFFCYWGSYSKLRLSSANRMVNWAVTAACKGVLEAQGFLKTATWWLNTLGLHWFLFSPSLIRPHPCFPQTNKQNKQWRREGGGGGSRRREGEEGGGGGRGRKMDRGGIGTCLQVLRQNQVSLSHSFSWWQLRVAILL